jgi:hypothetical protein
MSKSNISAVPKLLDTSAIIDGRILDVIRCGFIAYFPARTLTFRHAFLNQIGNLNNIAIM